MNYHVDNGDGRCLRWKKTGRNRRTLMITADRALSNAYRPVTVGGKARLAARHRYFELAVTIDASWVAECWRVNKSVLHGRWSRSFLASSITPLLRPSVRYRPHRLRTNGPGPATALRELSRIKRCLLSSCVTTISGHPMPPPFLLSRRPLAAKRERTMISNCLPTR